jgi:diguanylate cyclase (GGDEF)-like protein
VTEPNQRTPRPTDPSDRRIRRSWAVFAGSLVALALVAAVQLGGPAADLLDWIILGLVAAAGVAAVIHERAVSDLDGRHRTEAASFARILSGLSRSVSPDAILDAIVEEVGRVAEADHLVIVRRRPDARVLEARLVSSRTGIPESTTLLPISDLEDPVEGEGSPSDPARVIADRIAQRASGLYGLKNPLAAPLTAAGGVIGAIVVSRRSRAPWTPSIRQLLDAAAAEGSAALARAYSHRAAELQASTDPLTGLPNRRYFDEYVGLLARRRRAGDAVGVLMVDIDRFKVLNDTFGHATGDEVLREVAGAIVGAVREDDVPARFGGEEFVVLLRNPGADVALDVGERVRTAVRALDLRRHGVPGVSVSVGVAVADGPDDGIAELIASADRALYRAKRAGRDRVIAA